MKLQDSQNILPIEENEETQSVKIFKDLKDELPTGITEGEHLVKNFSLNEWNFGVEKRISKARQDCKTQGQYVSQVIKNCVKSIGKVEDFASLEEKEQNFTLAKLQVGDVFHIYCWVRVDAIDEKVEFNAQCPSCNNADDYIGNLFEMEVRTKQKPSDQNGEYKLIKPVKAKEGEIDTFYFHSPMWTFVENLSQKELLDPALYKEKIFQQTIHGTNLRPEGYFLTPDVADQFNKRDTDGLLDAIEQNIGGPLLQAKVDCKQCRYRFNMPFEWRYDNFFSSFSK